MWTPSRVWNAMEQFSGEKLERKYDSLETLQQRLADAKAKLATDPENYALAIDVVGTQYLISWGIRGDNTPESAKYLGYPTSKELYPDFQFTSFESYLRDEVLAGKAKGMYVEKRAQFAKAQKDGQHAQ